MTSKRGRKSVERVAADANVILSAVLGHAAIGIFTRFQVKVVSTEGVLAEVREYLPRFAKINRITPEILEGQLRLLGIKSVPREKYKRKFKEAKRRMGKRDPDDVDLLALALSLRIAVWSNDSDFEEARVDWYTTAELLKVLESMAR